MTPSPVSTCRLLQWVDLIGATHEAGWQPVSVIICNLITGLQLCVSSCFLLWLKNVNKQLQWGQWDVVHRCGDTGNLEQRMVKQFDVRV